ncbi:hypothetical protein LMG27177_05942 [Paraburkholderia fynbosensis]|uniref:Uncharacterized protein n=1 Tax=Paraburkholderia fynbosensis TaxID=1200993 RepID=A0A6J5GRS8_9BURK|nr:hypothetical protein LMG27177_05942 [Paraburkholderia fynbosensis]
MHAQTRSKSHADNCMSQNNATRQFWLAILNAQWVV